MRSWKRRRFKRERDVRGTAFEGKSLPRKPIFWLTCFGRLYEKERESRGFEQARSDDLLSLFLRASRAPDGAAVRACRICCVVAPAGERRFAAAKRAGLTISLPQRRTLPLVPLITSIPSSCAQALQARPRCSRKSPSHRPVHSIRRGCRQSDPPCAGRFCRLHP